jgi:hypothetical protein
MRTSAASTIVKDYAVCDDCTIQRGDYAVEIFSNYPANFYAGEKYLVLSNAAVEYSVLAIALLVVAGLLFVYAAFFFLADCITPDRDMRLLPSQYPMESMTSRLV